LREIVFHPVASATRWILGQDNLMKRFHVRETFRHLNLRSADEVLEVGASALYYAGEIAKRVRRCVAVDYFKGFELQLRDRRFPASLELVRADAHGLPFRDESFDKVFLSEIFPVLASPDRCIAEAYRVLKPGGRVITVHGNVYKDMAEVFQEPSARRLVRLANSRWGTPTSFDGFAAMYFSLHKTNPDFFKDRDAYVRGLLAGSGFDRLEMTWAMGRAARLQYCRLLLRALARTGKPVLGQGQVLHLPHLRFLESLSPAASDGFTLICSATKGQPKNLSPRTSVKY
jgi:SAM-dependent methyltransferase